MAGGQVTGAAVRDDAPEADDFGLVTRPVTSGAAPVIVKPVPAGTSTRTDVGQAVVSVLILAANANRLGATVFNDPGGSENLFLNFGPSASLVDFVVRLTRNGYFEVPFNYTGSIFGIWDGAGGGFARVAELTL